LQQDIGPVPHVKSLSRLYYHYVAPLRAVAQAAVGWQDRGTLRRRLRRARKDPVDTIEISAEAMFRFAALHFDPQHITFEDAGELGRTLREGGAIDRRTEIAFNRGIAVLQGALTLDQHHGPVNLLAELEKLSAQPGHSRHRSSHISLAIEILRTIDIRRRGLPPARNTRT
jgi:hypothetical protein